MYEDSCLSHSKGATKDFIQAHRNEIKHIFKLEKAR